MDFGALELQIFVSLAVVLGVVFVAFLTDFLKGNNEALRERNIELVVRQEERERHQAEMAALRAEAIAAQAMRLAPQGSPPVTASMPVAVSPEPAMVETEAPPIQMDPEPEVWASDEELAEIDEMASRIRDNAVASEMTPAVEPEPAAEWEAAEPPRIEFEPDDEEAPSLALDEDTETDVLAETGARLEEDVAEEEERISGETEEEEESEADDDAIVETLSTGENGGLPRLTIHAKVTPIDVISAERAAASETFFLARELERVAKLTESEPLRDGREEAPFGSGESFGEAEPELEEVETAPEGEEREAEATEEPVLAAEELVPAAEEAPAEKAHIETEVEEEPPADEAAARTLEMPSRREAESEQIRIPTGFQDFSLLSAAMNSKALFRGTAVAISVSGMSGSREESEKVAAFLESLLTPADFACQSSEDEFLLILPDETGAGAQRRLQYISQRLWDYQIRTMGVRALMFSWGAAEISGEPLRDAIGAAKDRMWQTRRNRERHSAEIHHYRVRVAND